MRDVKPSEQRDLIEKCYLKEGKEGDIWYILSMTWYLKWRHYTKFNDYDYDGNSDCDDRPEKPGIIKNSILLDNGRLRRGLLVNTEILFVCEPVWKLFIEWYGCDVEDHLIFMRKMRSSSTGKPSLDLYPVSFVLINKSNPKEKYEKDFCNAETIGFVKEFIRSTLDLLPTVEIVLFSGYFMEEVTADDSVTLQEASLDGENILYFEIVKNELPSRSNGDMSTDNLFSPSTAISQKFPVFRRKPGLVGLNNLGNTCFMNSAIQCLSNVPELTDYFLSDKISKDLNVESPLGSRGKIARSFAELIRTIWSPEGCSDVVSPRNLKTQIGVCAPQFVGYQQHDAHELLMFLCDFLSEDLNKIRVKPYIETKDAAGRADEEVANESWNNYKMRNDSIIVDLFHGLLKSTVICPECNFVSVTFDPFASLSLPLHLEEILVSVWPADESSAECRMLRYRLSIPPSCTCAQVLRKLRRLRNLPNGYRFVLTRVSVKDEFEILDETDDENLRKTSKSIVVFELPQSLFVQVSLTSNQNEIMDPFLVELPRKKAVIAADIVFELIYNKLLSSFQSLAKSFQKSMMNGSLSVIGMDAALDARPGHKLSIDLPEITFDPETPVFIQTSLHLYDTLELFTSAEKLGFNDSWYCKQCKDHLQASKKFDLWRLPKILIIHLKRFRSVYRFNKIISFIDCPLDGLEIYNAKGEKSTYDLVAVSNHMGGLGGGHYTANCKNRSDGKWYCFDDSYVRLIDEGSIVTSAAYVLIYVRRGDQLNGNCNHCYEEEPMTVSENGFLNGELKSSEADETESVDLDKLD